MKKHIIPFYSSQSDKDVNAYVNSKRKLNKPKRLRAIGKTVRLTSKTKDKLNSEGGGSQEARLCSQLEKQIARPIKVVNKRKIVYTYNQNGGYWQLVPGEQGLGIFKHLAWDVQEVSNRNSTTADKLMKALDFRNHIKEGEQFCGAIKYMKGDSSYYINCPSRVFEIDFKTGKILKDHTHSKDYMFSGCLGEDYNEKAKCPIFRKTLEEVLPTEAERNIIGLFFATVLLPDCRQEKALLCFGGGGNGKNIITEAGANAIGEPNRLVLTLEEICSKDRKHIYRLENKLLNLATETKFQNHYKSDVTNRIISGEPLETEEIYKTGFQLTLTCKLCFLCNHLPKFADVSNAVYQRYIILHFPYEIRGTEKEDILLDQKLATSKERQGMLRWFFELLPTVAVNKVFNQKLDIKEDFKLINEPWKPYFESCLVVTKRYNDFLQQDDIRKCYKAFLLTKGIESNFGLSGGFFSKLYEWCPELRSDTAQRERFNGKQEYVVRGVKFSELGKKIMLELSE